MTKATDAEVEARLRRALDIPSGYTDEDILAETKGSLMRAQIELNVALRDLGRTILAAFDMGHDYGPRQQVSKWTAVYPCRRCGARWPSLRRCKGPERSSGGPPSDVSE